MASGEEEGLFDFLPEQAAPERVGGGLPRLRFAERMQTRWRPVSLDGLLPDDHRVRLVWSFVEGLDLTALLATIKAVDGRPGHPPADPRILLALWLYATVEGIGSAREVARLCDEHIAFEWLCGGVGMNAKTLADFRVDHGAVLECLLVDSFTALVRAGVASLDRVAQDGVRVRASAGAASFRRHSTLQECRCEAEKAVHDLRTQLDTDPGAASRKQAAARRRATEDRERRVRAALAVTEELHAKQQEAARKEAERAARKAPQDAAADAKGEAGEPASKKGSAARSSRPPGRPAIGGRACRAQAGRPGDELDGTPVRDAADLQLRLALLKDRRSRRIRHVGPRRRGDGARREEREPAARYSSRNQASRNTSA